MASDNRAGGGLEPFRYRNYRLFWMGQVATNTGTWTQMVATGWLVLQVTNSPASLGINAALQGIPTIGFAFLGGVVGDRVDRFRLMVGGQVVQLGPDIALAIMVGSGHVKVEYVFAYSFLSAVVNGLVAPGRQAFVPKLVPASALLPALALNSTVWQGAAVVGPSFAGVVLAAWGIAACFYVNVASDLINLLSLVFLRVKPDAFGKQQSSAWADMVQGANYAWRDGTVRTILLTVTALNLFGRSYQQLLPVFAANVYHVGPQGLGVMMSMPAIGAVLSGVTLAMIGGLDLTRWLVVGAGGLAIALVIFCLCPVFLLTLPILVIIGFSSTGSMTVANTLLQQIVPDRLRGRVMSLQVAGAQGGWKMGALPGGFLAQATSAPAATIVGAVMLMAVLVPVVRSKSLRITLAGSEQAIGASALV